MSKKRRRPPKEAGTGEVSVEAASRYLRGLVTGDKERKDSDSPTATFSLDVSTRIPEKFEKHENSVKGGSRGGLKGAETKRKEKAFRNGRICAAATKVRQANPSISDRGLVTEIVERFSGTDGYSLSRRQYRRILQKGGVIT